MFAIFGALFCGKGKATWVILANIIIWIAFGLGYAAYLQNHEETKWATNRGDNVWLDGMYISTIIHGTVGYGDFFPKHWTGKLIVICHALLVFFLNVGAGLCSYSMTPGYMPL